jgi:2-dehydropantoate 2-reductase
MRICIFGAGAIGGWLGAHLASQGQHVSVIARGQTLDALQAHGLRLQQASGLLQVPVQAAEHATELGVQDLVIVAVKAPAMEAVARGIGPLLGTDTMVLTAMNGVPWWFLQGLGDAFAATTLKSVDASGSIATAIPARHIIGGVVHASCSLLSPGFVQQHFGNRLILGEPSGRSSQRVQELAALLHSAGVGAEVSAHIQRDTWFKLWGNMTVNPISALTGATTDLILGDPLVRDFVSRVMLEAKEIGTRLGLPIDQQPEDRHAMTLKLGAFKTSMLQDFEAGKPIELDALVSAVQELGVLTHVPTPFTDGLLGLTRLHARMRGLY